MSSASRVFYSTSAHVLSTYEAATVARDQATLLAEIAATETAEVAGSAPLRSSTMSRDVTSVTPPFIGEIDRLVGLRR
jgi:hypothetical protein